MNTEKLFIADPYNEEHIKMFSDFELTNSITTKTSTYLKSMKEKYTKDEYDEYLKESNIITQSLFLEDNSIIKDCCYINGEKDRKACTLYFSPLKEETKNRRLISIASDYVFNALGMEEVFINANTNDTNLVSNLKSKGFESLGEENGVITFLKEKEDEKEIGKVI